MTKQHLATSFDTADDSPGLLLWRLTNQWQAKQRAALKDFDLTHVQFVLLASLVYTEQEHAPTQKQLAEFARTNVMMTSQVLRKLEQKGLITRSSSTKDSRSVIVKPTAVGVRLANKAVNAVEEVDRMFFAKTGDELPKFIGILQRLDT